MEHCDEVVFDLPKNKSNIIKVIGVGGGGSNAVNYMYSKGIEGVDFVVCNTDVQALENSPISNKVILGMGLTEGLGAGGKPKVGEDAASESAELIVTAFGDHTKMVFITAGMGGGTGTGAAPVIAKVAKELDILTVGIITKPFDFEGEDRKSQAIEGLKKMKNNVDALIIINNNKLLEIYGDLGYKSGFAKADEVLLNAAKGIAEVISRSYLLNIDLHDVKTVLSNSGTAVMGTAVASGDDRAKRAIEKAINSPLLENNSILGIDNVLLLITSGAKETTLGEIEFISNYIHEQAGKRVNIITGIGDDPDLKDAISVIITATGVKNIPNVTKKISLPKKTYPLYNNTQTTEFKKSEDILPLTKEASRVDSKNPTPKNPVLKCDEFIITEESSDIEDAHSEMQLQQSSFDESIPQNEEKISLNFSLEAENSATKSSAQDNCATLGKEEALEKITISIRKESVDNKTIPTKGSANIFTDEEQRLRSEKQKKYIQIFNSRYQSSNLEEMEKEPAYKRQGIDISRDSNDNTMPSNTSISVDKNNRPHIRSNNSFLHGNVD